jgi:multidrug efflux pump subunit AcrA (membrane-fusion protein)
LDKVELFAEVSGILIRTPKRFKEGNRFSKGELLIQIDDAVYKNNVLAQKSGLLNQITLLLPDLSIDFPESAVKWERYLHNFDLAKPLASLPEPFSDQERYYVASRNIYNQFYQIKSMEETLAKYTIEAPYNGVITQSNINPGTLVRNGQKLGEFTNTSVYEMEASVGINNVQYLKIGDFVQLVSEDIAGNFRGQIQRINEVIDPSTQTVKVYIHTRDPNLKDGMYLIANINSDPIRNAFSLSKDLLVQDQAQVFAVENSTLVLKDIKIVREETAHILVTGLDDGTQILAEQFAEAREGMTIQTGNKQPNKTRGGNEERN